MIARVRLQHFRKHEDFETTFQPGTTIITGPNGSGKTSLIEAIHIAIQGKSWRSDFTEMIKNDQDTDWWRLDIDFIDGEKRTAKFIDGKKTFIINDKEYSRLPARLKKPVILFEPSDLQLLYGSPNRRRTFFDRFIAQVDPTHAVTLRRFERVLSQRNNLLKNGASRNNLFVWDIQFADLAEKIISARTTWIKRIGARVTEQYQAIANTHDEISLGYSASHKTRAAILAQLDEEYALGLPFTRSGPQTHDVKIKINNHDAKTTASRGENRTIIFAMLYSMIELANEELDSNIYLLFDDIDSELDSTHQKNLYLNNIFNNNYLFATTIATKHRAANRLRFD